MKPGDWAELQAYSTKPEPKFSVLWDLEFTMKPEASAKLQAYRLGIYYEFSSSSRTPSL